MNDIKVNNISKGILKRIKSERDVTEEQIYALWDGVVELLDTSDSHEYCDEFVQLLERMNDTWMYQDFKSSSVSQNFLYGSIWGSLNIIRTFLEKKEEQYNCQALAQKYRDETSFLFLQAIYKKPGIKNNVLAQLCCVTPSRISQMTQIALAEGLIISQKSGREKYFYIKTRGTNVYETILKEKRAEYPKSERMNYEMITFNNQILSPYFILRTIWEAVNNSVPGKDIVGVAVAYKEKEQLKYIEPERRETLCWNETNRLSNNCINLWELQKETNMTKRPLYTE